MLPNMAIAAGLALYDFPFSDAAAFWRWVDVCEAGEIDSIWQSDRLVTENGRPMLECMSAMAALAGATRRLKFGMFVASAGLRDPLLLARQCATIDMLSEGRLLPAFGVGNATSADWQATCTETRGRGRRTDEALDIIAALWRGESVTFCGEFHRYREATISPLPAQAHIPLWIGGSSPAAIRRTARIGTGWVGGSETPAEAARVVDGIKRACQAIGREIESDHYGGGFSYRFGDEDDEIVRREIERYAASARARDPRDSMVIGGRGAILERIREFVDAGVTKFVLRPLGDSDDDLIEQTRRLIEEVLPSLASLETPAAGGPR